MLQKYVHQRGNIYHFRWRIPVDLHPILGVTELTHSLKTTDKLQAGIRAGRFALVVTDIQRVRQSYLAFEIDFDGYMLALGRYWGRICYMARKTIKTGMITAYDPSGIMLEIQYKGDDGKDDEKKEVAVAKELGYACTLGEPTLFFDHNSANSMFTEVFDDFMSHKMDATEAAKEGRNPLSKKQQSEHKRNFIKLLSVMGDMPISAITQRDLKEAILTCANLPRMNKKPYNRMEIHEVLEMDIPGEDRIAGKTAIEIKKTVQGVFRYAVDVAELIDASPAKGMRLGIKQDSMCTFAPYTDAEVRTILAASFKEAEPWKKWLPTLAAYTGARRGELAQIRKQDVKWDSDAERHYILITDEAGSVKNENATRQVPLHSALIENGFLEFVDLAGDRLFDDLEPNMVTKWFMPYRDKLGIERFDDFGNRKVFHSFRHTFITKSRGAGNVLEHVQQVVGHEKTSAGVTDRYDHRKMLKVVLDVVDRVEYE